MMIRLSDHFSCGRLLRFTLPTIAMMILTSVYSVVDGFFVSNFAGKLPFSAVNLIMPFLMILSAVGLMFGTGGTAIVAYTLGTGDRAQANRHFSLFVYVTFAAGAVLSALGIIFLRPVSYTHLDVYKRQVPRCSAASMRRKTSMYSRPACCRTRSRASCAARSSPAANGSTPSMRVRKRMSCCTM